MNGIHEDQENKGTIIGDVSGEDLHKVTLSVDLDAKKVYCWLDGEQKAELTLPDGWTMKEDAHSFTIGGGYNGLSVYPCPGIIKDVAIYDFAMNDAVAKIYAKQGDIYTSDISTLASVEKIEVVFEGEPTSKALNSIMTTELQTRRLLGRKCTSKTINITQKDSFQSSLVMQILSERR